MTTREPVFYEDFRCLGGQCPLTCCRDWDIVLDEDALADYQTAPEPLRRTIAGNLVTDGEGDVCFRLRPDGLCALLDGDGLCPIQRHWGEEHLCAHCGAYPRFIEEYGCLTESCQAVSCPEAARLVMERGLFPLREADDGAADAPFDGVDPELLDGLTGTRRTAFALLTGSAHPLWPRLSALLDYAGELQDRIDFGLPLAGCGLPSPRTGADSDGLRTLAVRVLDLLAGLEPLRAEWPELLRRRAAELAALSPARYTQLTRDFQAAYPQWEPHLEHLACYFVFRHWPKVVNDGLLYGRAALASAACLALYHLALLSWREAHALSPADEALLWAAFSREVEHLDENFDALVDELSDQAVWPLAKTFGM